MSEIIDAAVVKKLRDKTDAGMMDCKKALIEAKGDFDKAVDLLRTRGLAIAQKKSSRTASQGVVRAVIEGDKLAVLFEINCETDFVAKGDKFQVFVDELTKFIVGHEFKAAGEAALVQELLAAPFQGRTVNDYVVSNVAVLGENIVPRRFVRWTLKGAGRFYSYIHMGGKIGVMVELGFGKAETAGHPKVAELGRDLCLQIASMSPLAVSPDGLPEAVVAREKAIYVEQAKELNKPPAVVEKIIQGKLEKWFKESCLLNQLFVKDNELTIDQLAKKVGQEAGDTITVRRFVRFMVGDGLDK